MNRIRHKIREFASGLDVKYPFGVKHLTLSCPNDDNLFNGTRHLIKSFRKLRQRAYWKKNVKGGAFVVEIKRGEHGWHPHLHIVITARYMDYKVLKQHWTDVSGGQAVYIQKLPVHMIVRYLTKYITKSEMPLADQMLATETLKGLRLFNPFGDWFKPLSAIKAIHPACGDCGNSAWAFVPGKYDYDTVIRMTTPFCDLPDPGLPPPLKPCQQVEIFPYQVSI